MAAITDQYNIAVQSRFYAFIESADYESAEPNDLIADIERKKEMQKENRAKAKKEKRGKQPVEMKKETKKEILEEPVKIETEAVVAAEKTNDTPSPQEEEFERRDDSRGEKKFERGGSRGRGAGRRGNGQVRRPKDGKPDDFQSRSAEEPSGSNFDNFNRTFSRGRPYRRERADNDGFDKMDTFEDPFQSAYGNSGSAYRGGMPRRRSSGNRGGRYSRGGTDRSRSFEDDQQPTQQMHDDIIPEKMETFEDSSVRQQMPRRYRGRFFRGNRGSFGRNFQQNATNENEEGAFDDSNRIGYFNEGSERRPFRGMSRGGRFRGTGGRGVGRGMRRGRGGFRRSDDESQDEQGGYNREQQQPVNDRPTSPSYATDKWPSAEEDDYICSEEKVVDPELPLEDASAILPTEPDTGEVKKSNWCDVEDDPGDIKPTNLPTMTLEEWKALHAKDKLTNQCGKENRKANDGKDVFSGMEEYRKGGRASEGEPSGIMEQNVHENATNLTRQKQAIPVAIRFSRSTEYTDVSNPVEQFNSGGDRGYSRGGSSGSFNRGSGRGRPRGGSDFNGYGRGRDFNRGRGRFNKPISGGSSRKEDHGDGININLGNEEEFPTLS